MAKIRPKHTRKKRALTVGGWAVLRKPRDFNSPQDRETIEHLRASIARLAGCKELGSFRVVYLRRDHQSKPVVSLKVRKKGLVTVWAFATKWVRPGNKPRRK